MSLQEIKDPAKDWAKGFDKLDSFSQMQSLHNMYTHALSVELKLQIVNLLTERVMQYSETLAKEEAKLKEQIVIAKKVQSLQK